MSNRKFGGWAITQRWYLPRGGIYPEVVFTQRWYLPRSSIKERAELVENYRKCDDTSLGIYPVAKQPFATLGGYICLEMGVFLGVYGTNDLNTDSLVVSIQCSSLSSPLLLLVVCPPTTNKDPVKMKAVETTSDGCGTMELVAITRYSARLPNYLFSLKLILTKPSVAV